ncbi:MAG: hypothetical protein ACI86H_001150 [bacterium]|jgi:hypothetical protein
MKKICGKAIIVLALFLLTGCQWAQSLMESKYCASWANPSNVPANHVIASASYEIFPRSTAKKNAFKKALGYIAGQKEQTAHVRGQTSSHTGVSQHNGRTTSRSNASSTSQVTFEGQVKAKGEIRNSCIYEKNKQVWILVEDMTGR